MLLPAAAIPAKPAKLFSSVAKTGPANGAQRLLRVQDFSQVRNFERFTLTPISPT